MTPAKNNANAPSDSAPSKIERAAFRDRLLAALKTAGLPTRPTKLTAQFNSHFPGVPVGAQAVRKWLLGESIPTQDKLRTLAAMLGTTSEWLRFGAEPVVNAHTILEDIEALDGPLQNLAHQIIRNMLAYKRGQQQTEAAHG